MNLVRRAAGAEVDSREVGTHLGHGAPVVSRAAHCAEGVVPGVDGRLISDVDGRLIVLDVVGRVISDVDGR